MFVRMQLPCIYTHVRICTDSLIDFVIILLVGYNYSILAFGQGHVPVVGVVVCVLHMLSLVCTCSFSFLWGPWNHLKHLLTLERLPFTAAYVLSIVGTLWAALWVSVHHREL